MRARKGLIGILLVVILLTGVSAFCVLSGVTQTETQLFAADEVQYDIYDLSFSEWTPFTYYDAPSWQEKKVNIAETEYDALSYSLSQTATDFYAVDTSLVSPCLPLFASNDYSFTFAYYTKMRAQTPDILTVSVSKDGVTFEDVSSLECSKVDEAQTVTVSLSEKDFYYIRLSLHVFYEKDTASDLTDRAFYLLLDGAFLQTQSRKNTEDDFQVSCEETLVYSGERQVPSVTVSSEANEEGSYYYTQQVSGESVLPGAYTVSVSIYNRSHRLQKTVVLDYTIQKAELSLVGSLLYLYNESDISILGCTFVDKDGRTVSVSETSGWYCFTKAGDKINRSSSSVIAVPDETAYEIGIGIADSSCFEDYSVSFPVAEENKLTASGAPLPYTATPFLTTFTATYTGNEINLADFIKFDGIPSNCTLVSATEVGQHSVTLTYGEKDYCFTLNILPAVLSEGIYTGDGFSKEYDGNCDLFDKNGVYTGTVDDEKLSLGVEGVTLSYTKMQSARSYGTSYLVPISPVLTGEKAKNYILSDDFVILSTEKITVEATSAVLYSAYDSLGQTITVQTRAYEKGNYAATIPSSYQNAVLPIYGTEEIEYDDVAFFFTDENVGTHEISITVSNPSFYDRYLPEVVVTVPLYGTITPAVLTVEETAKNGLFTDSSADVYHKEYDGTKEATGLTFRRLILQNQPEDFPDFSRYTVSFASAVFDSENAGTQSFTVSGITLSAKDSEAEEFLQNYTVADMTASGVIDATVLKIYTNYVRISERQSLPVLETSAPSQNGVRNDSVLQKRIFHTVEEAKTLQNEVSENKTTAGRYFLRADIASDNYTISDTNASFVWSTSDYVILTMDVTEKEKVRQTLLSDTLSLGSSSYAMLVGGSFTPDYVSYVEGEQWTTGLTVSYTVEDKTGCVTFDGKTLTAVDKGTFTVTCRQKGNDYYYAADDVVLTITVLDNALAGNIQDEEAWFDSGEPLPVFTPEEFSVYQDGEEIAGTVTPTKTLLKEGNAYYLYQFSADTVLAEFTADYSVRGNYYVKSGSAYTVADIFSPYQDYYERDYRTASVTAGASVAVARYYEKEFLPTEDNYIQKDTVYYYISYQKDETVAERGSEVVPCGVYYEKGEEENYFLTQDTAFDAEKEYYRLVYTVAPTEEGVSVREYDTLYEETDTFTLTHDTVFQSGKTYYEAVYYPVFFIQEGATVDNTLYYVKSGDTYTPTGDKTFTAGKEYYRLYYTEVFEAQENVDTYYEKTVSYEETEDTSFIQGKTYYYEKDGHYLPLYNKVGETRGETYYEEVISFAVATPDFLVSSYYIASYKQVVFTENNSLSGGIYYCLTDLYEKTTDSIFDPYTTYYTVSFEKAETEGGTFIEGQYYAEKNTDSVLTQRYFGYQTTYYQAVFTAQDFSSLRTVNHSFDYFVRATAFEEDKKDEYYVFSNNLFEKTGAEAETFSSGIYYLPLDATTEEFSQGTTYYYLSYPFIGSYSVSLPLQAKNPTATVYFKSSAEIVYGTEPDFADAVQKVVITKKDSEETLSYDKAIAFLRENLVFSVNKDISREKPGTVTVFVNPSSPSEEDIVLTAESLSAGYKVVLQSSTVTYTVRKAKVKVSLQNVEKYYGEVIPSGEGITASWKITGIPSFDNSSAETLRAYTSSVMQLYSLSSVGYYPIFLSAKDDATFQTLTDYYDFEFIKSFIYVKPIHITVSTNSPSHTYGEDIQEITLRAKVDSTVDILQDSLQELTDEVLSATQYQCAVSTGADSGVYPIELSYGGTNGNIIVALSDTDVYTVKKATLNKNGQDFVLEDKSVLYDGKLYTLTVSYDESIWTDVTVTYDKDRFSAVGTYEYTATVTKKNYEPLTLKAKLVIGTLEISSSNLLIDAVTLRITDENCTQGISSKMSVSLISLMDSEEDKTAVDTLLQSASDAQYTVQEIYSLLIKDERDYETNLDFMSYTVSIVPKDLTYSSDLLLYGYVGGQYTKIDYTYENGTYTFSVGKENAEDANPLQYFAFVTAEKEDTSFGIGEIAIIAIIVAAVIIMLAFFVVSGKSVRRAHRRSRRRHNRLV